MLDHSGLTKSTNHHEEELLKAYNLQVDYSEGEERQDIGQDFEK